MAAISINAQNRSIRGKKAQVGLTPCEYSLLTCLIDNEGGTLSRSDLLRDAWHWDYATEVKTKTVDMHVRRVRAKLERAGLDPQLIVTVRGSGYAINV